MPTATYDLITTASGTGSSSIIDITSIPQTYSTLVIIGHCSATASGNTLNIRFNNNSSGVYHYVNRIATTSSMSAQTYTGTTNFLPLTSSYAVTTSNSSTAIYLTLNQYATANRDDHTFQCLGNAQNAGMIIQSEGVFSVATAITSIRIYLSTDSFATTTRFHVFGLAGV